MDIATIALAISDSNKKITPQKTTPVAPVKTNVTGVAYTPESTKTGTSTIGNIDNASDFKKTLITILKTLDKPERDKIIEILKQLFNVKTNTFSIKEIKYYKGSEYLITNLLTNTPIDANDPVGNAILTYYEYSKMKIKSSENNNLLTIQIKGYIDKDKPLYFLVENIEYKMELKKYEKLTIRKGTITPQVTPQVAPPQSSDEDLSMALVAMEE